MTDRPAGTPDPDATDPEAGALDNADAETTEFAAPDGTEPGAERELTDDAVEADDDVEPDAELDQDADVDPDAELDEEPEPDDYDAAVREVAGEGAVVPVAAAGAGAASIPTRRKPTPTPSHVQTASEKAVHVREDVSKIFVIGAVAVFTAILLNGLLLGRGGLLAPIPTASPSASVAPSASASAGPSASASAPASPSASAPASAGASTPASPAASAAASVAPSP